MRASARGVRGGLGLLGRLLPCIGEGWPLVGVGRLLPCIGEGWPLVGVGRLLPCISEGWPLFVVGRLLPCIGEGWPLVGVGRLLPCISKGWPLAVGVSLKKKKKWRPRLARLHGLGGRSRRGCVTTPLPGDTAAERRGTREGLPTRERRDISPVGNREWMRPSEKIS